MSKSFFIQLAVYEIFDIVPFVSLAAVAFRSKVKSSKRIVLLTAALFLLGVLRRSVSLLIPSMSGILSVLWPVIYLILYRCAVCARLPKLLFVLITVLNYASMSAILYNYIGSCLFGDRLLQNPYGIEASISIVIVLGVSYPILFYWFAYRLFPLLDKQENDRIWDTLWLVPLTFCCIFYYNLYTSGNIFTFSSDLEKVIFSVGVSAGSFFVLSLILRLVEANALTLRLQSQNHQLEMNILQFQHLSEQIEKARQARHDQRQLINVLQVYLKSGDLANLNAFVERLCSSSPITSTIVYCKHPALNALICYYADLCEQRQTGFSAHICFQEKTGIEDMDLIVLFGNLLENAFEACERQKSGERFIRLTVKNVGCQIILLLDNSFDGIIKKDGDRFLSSKRFGTGIGTASIRQITEKYQGTVSFENDGAVFKVSVRLNAGLEMK